MADSWAMHSQHLDQTVLLATDALFKAVDANPGMTEVEYKALCGALVDRYGSVAVSSALWAIESGRVEAGQNRLPAPVAAPALNPEQVVNSASWSLSRTAGNVSAAARVFAGPLGRMVRQPARETVWESTAAAGSRYVRVPGPKACSFCLMLASRGAVYTKSTVLTTGQSRIRKGDARQTHTRNPGATGGHRYTSGKRAEGLKYHDHCSCTAQESFTDADLPQIVKDLQDEWYDVTYDAQGRMKPNQKKAWDEHIAETRGTAASGSDVEAAASSSPGATLRGGGGSGPPVVPPGSGGRTATGGPDDGDDDWKNRIIDNGVNPMPHEKVTHETLARAGHTVELRPVSSIEGKKSADAFLDGELTEMKAPEGNAKGTVTQLIRIGRKQSPRIVIDLHRTDMTPEEVIKQVDAALTRYDDVESVTIITKDREFVRRDRNHGQ